MKSARLFLVAVAILLATTVSFGQQSFMDEPGIPSFTTSFSVEHGFINLANGNLHLEIPIATYSQRGNIKALHARLVYDSRFWTISTNNNEIQSWTPSLPQIGVNVGGMFRLVTDGEGGTWGNDHGVVVQCACENVGVNGQCQPRYKTTYSNYFYQDPAGTRHSPWWQFKMVNNDPVCSGAHPSGDANVYAADNSGYLLVIRNYSVSSVLAPDGTQVYPNVQDTNGNTYNTVQGQDTFTRNVVDTLGRTPVIATSSGNQWFLDYLCTQGCNSANGDRARVTVTSTSSPSWATHFNETNSGGAVGEWSGPGNNLQSISLPDGTSYQFQYDSYGQITSMTLPTGGQITYGYTNFTDQAGNVNRWVTSMVRDGQTWNFTPTNLTCSAGICPLQVTVTTPAYNDGNVTASDNHVYLFSVINQGISSGSWNTQIQYFRGAVSGSPVLTKNIDYGSAGACPAIAGLTGNIPLPIRETLTWPSGSGTLGKKAEYCYDNYANVTATKEWDYKPGGNFAAAPDREIDNVYHTDPTADATFISANLIRLLKTSTTLGAGTQVAQSSFGYDETAFQPSTISMHHITPSASLGNQTSTTKWINTGGSVTSTTKWFDTGEVYQAIDPLLHTTTLSYDSALFGAYLTKSCNALSPMQCSYNGYDLNTGLRTSFTDVNGSQAGDPTHTTNYTFDSLLRPLCTIFPDGGQTCLSYPDANHLLRTQIITSGLNDLSTTIFDGLGRTVHTQHTLPAGISTVDTHYDPVGIPDTVSNPYFTTSDPTYGITQGFHDALGRTIKTVKQDGSVVVIKREDTPADPSAVSLLCTTVTDESGKTRQSCSNGFGELAKVVEPNPSSVATNATGWVTVSGSDQTTNGTVSITVANRGFEAPALGAGNFQYSPAGGSWTFGGGTGISANGSGFTSGNPGAPEGSQVAFIQFGADDVFYQSLSGFQTGVSYTVSFSAAQRGNSSNGGQDFDVYLDSTLLGTFRPASTSYSALSTAPFTTTAGTHTLRFVGRDSAGGDNTAFIDAVQITGTVVIADAGTVTVSVNGTPYSTSFGAGDTSTTIASRLATAISAGPYASATASGGTVNLASKTAGTMGDYSLTASYTWNSSQFTNSSFTTSTSGAALSGAYNAGDIGNNPFVTLYAYDALGNLLRVDQKGSAPNDSTQWRTRTFTYDSLSRLLTANNPESGTITYSYDADGELLQKTSPAPNQTGSATQTVSYCYDPLHRVTGKGYGAQNCPLTTPVVSYAYDTGTNGKGHLTSLTDQAGTASYTYDIMGRMTAETRPIAGVSKGTSYTYNLDGSVKTLTYPSGRVVTYTPDSAGRLVSAVDGNGTNYVTSASYNPDGSLKSLLNGSTPSLNQNFQYTPRLQLCRITTLTSGTLPTSCTDSQHIGNIMDRGYDFHAGNGIAGSGTDNGNVFGITNYRDTSRSQAFTYDALNRLTSGWSSANTGAYSWGENYSIDAWGNLQISPMGGKAHGGSFQLSGNAQNRPTGLNYDAAGNLLSYLTANYTYDQENRLLSTAGVTYTYDGNGERVLKSQVINNVLTPVKRYWSMGGNTLAEGDGSGNLTAEYIYLGGKRVARIDLPTNSVHYYLSDHLGSTSIVASAAGAVEEESDFYPFGTEVVVTGPGVNELKFTGKRRDIESQLDYFGARYYSNGLGRFVAPDPLLNSGQPWNPQSWNRYAYVENNPLRYTDPTGLYKFGDCSGTAKECLAEEQRFRDSIEKAKEALKGLDPKSEEAKALKKALEKLGDEDEGDIKINFGDAGETDGRPNLGNTVGHTITINYDAVDSDAKNANLSPSEKAALDAGVTTHEGTHALGNGLKGWFQWHFEHPAYYTESVTYQGLHNTDKAFGLWNESWLTVDKDKLSVEQHRENAIQNAIHPPKQQQQKENPK